MGDVSRRELISHNPETDVAAEMMEKHDCKRLVFLEPLLGPVIKHVDMFALPVAANTILLASYQLDQPYVREHWRELNKEEQELTFEAALAMHYNFQTLRQLGFDVILVPAPLPRVAPQSGPYYPTMLNAWCILTGSAFR
jgi:hypothetical protein